MLGCASVVLCPEYRPYHASIHNLLSAVSEYIATSAGRDELGPDMPSSLSRGGGLAIKVF